MDHRQIDKTFRHFWTLFIILTQASKAIQPSKSTLNNPTFGQDLKAFLLAAVGHFSCYSKNLFTPVQQGIARIPAIEHKQSQSTEQGQSFQKPASCNFVLFIGGMNQNPQQPTLCIYGDLSFDAFLSLVRIKPNRPLFSAVCTDWLSTITTLGSASRSSLRRISIRSASLMASNALRSTSRRQNAYTASHAGKSWGNMRHWQPVRFKYKIALNISRRVWTGFRPRPSRFGSNGSIFAHCSSVKSVG